jgi:hypothetical protein
MAISKHAAKGTRGHQGEGRSSTSRRNTSSSQRSNFSRATNSSTGRRAAGTWDEDRDLGYSPRGASASRSRSEMRDDDRYYSRDRQQDERPLDYRLDEEFERSRRSPARRSYASIDSEERNGPSTRYGRSRNQEEDQPMDRDRWSSPSRNRYQEDDEFGEMDRDSRRYSARGRDEEDSDHDEEFERGRGYSARTRYNDIDDEMDEEDNRRAGSRDWNEDEDFHPARGSRSNAGRRSSYAGRGRQSDSQR